MADRSSHRHSNASDSDSQHTFHIAQYAPSILPKPPAPAVVRNGSGELNEKQNNGRDWDLEKQAIRSPRRTLEMTERYNLYSNRTPYDQSSTSSDETDRLDDQRLHLESKAMKILPLSDELRSLLARSNRLQLRVIYSFNITQGKNVSSLLLVHLLSPFVAMAVALSAWAVAIYWVFAAMIGDPDGTEGGGDGRATVLGLRTYWEMWLCKAMLQ
ncbi:unnamed protein product [Aureobasidium pullulans]|nr:hypothetical protein E4T50_16857 [Aureobasidium sp. EXF-12298]KAI4750700.1 hypothetical protein E4T51_16008 [Aureobasidium sp. EXF-12344]KAI4768141.1 hypothetical protein E4T52_16758 [Aureobasidium sp. EXF-3400]CAC9888845.1 unnamed protein product [Aureobasidium pullulans]CAD0011796.1 unnamed protein product [Aureobasidium pullulans]